MKTLTTALVSLAALCLSATVMAEPDQDDPARVRVTSSRPNTRILRLKPEFDAKSKESVGPVMSQGWVTLCETPCALQMKPGQYDLRLDGVGFAPTYERIHVLPGDNHVQADPGSFDLWALGALAAIVGGGGLVFGTTAWAIDQNADAHGREQSFGGAGPYIVLASVPLLVAGIWMTIEGSSSLSTATAQAGRF